MFACSGRVGKIMRSHAQTAELPSSPFQWRMDDTWMLVVLTKLRVLHGLPIATIVEGHHMRTARAAWGRPCCLHVMTTTLCGNAQELR